MNARNIFVEYMETALLNAANDDIRLKYEKQLLAKMEQKAENAAKAGLSDEKVICDLVISEYPDIKSDYEAFKREEKKKAKEKKLFKFLSWGSLVMLVSMFLIYFAVSFITYRWSETWLIIVGFVTVWFDCVAGAGIMKLTSMKKVFQIPARVLGGLAIMLTASFVFLICTVYFRFENFWVIFPAGVFCIFCADAVYSHVTKQRLLLINYLVYVPAAMPMLYLVLGGLHIIPWSPGWLLMPLSVAIDLLIALGAYINHRKYVYKPEKEEE